VKITPEISFEAPEARRVDGRISEASLPKHKAILAVTAKGERPSFLPPAAEKALNRARKLRPQSEAGDPVVAALPGGPAIALQEIDPSDPAHKKLSLLRAASRKLLETFPESIDALFGTRLAETDVPGLALYVLTANGGSVRTMKTGKGEKGRPLKQVLMHDAAPPVDEAELAAGNLLCRALTDAPGNLLTPALFERAIGKIARDAGFARQTLGKDKLRKAGAKAFLAVADSTPDPAFVVRLTRKVARPKLRVALVGKGVCFDTGGYNLKPGKYLLGMHGDMNGAAVALSSALALSRLDSSVEIDCWLGLAENHISPAAIRPGDVIGSHRGKTIEIVNTDAEGRLMLADLLSMATTPSARKPDVAVTFATLTGTMVYALGKRYSGMFATDEAHAAAALRCAEESGERLCRFPMDEDYHPRLKSKVADVLQCAHEGDGDHIMAARFLSEFLHEGTSWLHVDLSASTCPGGLGGISSETTGFGVRWAVRFIQSLAKETA